ncbi:hypothetical protein DFH08DRAFT_781645 [Mycena albidolilacea]|uniref:Uncharacterized protein n=1 Tax=Mycena albidolilacea TaxID=1033008 RepID=A0AAD6ZWY3_9AGAR|nr:hypothetical protein DFH08DRAFT_781645 [Mycena albidolilacea]
MFVDYCLSCGKELDDGRPYCNEQCQTGDLTSPSLSEASSAFSSPHQQYAHGQDVPALVPSALGRALRAYTAHDHYSASSSSASSASWSVLTDDDDSEFDDPHPDHIHLRPNALSYARHPSSTNNPQRPGRHCRTASSSSSLVCALPQSAPGDSVAFRHFMHDDDTDEYELDEPPMPATTSKSASARLRKRNRASLPTYFSMLQINSSNSSSSGSGTAPAPLARGSISPVSCASGHTAVAATLVAGRPSPPTPKLSLLASVVSPQAHTPRGRRVSTRGAHDGNGSRSPSPARRRDSDEKVADWSYALARERGRASVRRNSSPPVKMLSASPREISRSSAARSPSQDGGRRARTRGRARVEELEGPGSPAHPGFGFGRTGLMARARRGVGEEWAGLR